MSHLIHLRLANPIHTLDEQNRWTESVDRARDSGQVRAQINDWNHLVGHQILLLSEAQDCSENSVVRAENEFIALVLPCNLFIVSQSAAPGPSNHPVRGLPPP